VITWSYGGGIQTVGMAAMIIKGILPPPDLIVLSDTGREVQSTFDYLDKIIQPALKEIGLQVEIVNKSDYATVDLWRNDDMLLPVFTGNGNGKLPTFCSNEWKQRVIRRYLKDIGVEDTDLWLGISTDEAERMKDSGLKWLRHQYPLIELVPTNRDGCYQHALDMGWPEPNKSRCWMCPNQSAFDWRRLKRRSNVEFEKACQLEQEIQSIDDDMYLHRLGIPLAQAVEQSEVQKDMFDNCDSGYCMT